MKFIFWLEERRLNQFLAYFVAPICLMIYYRQGGIVDGFDPNNSLRDLGVLTRAGDSVIHGFSPYNDDGHWMKYGTIVSIPYGILGIILNAKILFVFSQIFNLAGVWFFIKIFFKFNPIKLSQIYLLTIATSAFREIFVDAQVMGHIAGFVALGKYLLDKEKESWAGKIRHFLGITSLVLAADLKPNLTLFLVIAVLTERSWKTRIFYFSIQYAIFYLILSLYIKRPIFFDWLNVLRWTSSLDNTKDIWGSVSIWQTLNNNEFLFAHINIFAPLLYLFVGSSGLFIFHKRQKGLGFALICVAPFFYSFFQYYSYTLISLFIVILSIYIRNSYFSGLILSMIIVFTEISTFTNVLIVISICAFTILFIRNEIGITKNLYFIGGVLTSLAIKITIMRLPLDIVDKKSLILIFVTLTYLLLFAREFSKNKELESCFR